MIFINSSKNRPRLFKNPLLCFKINSPYICKLAFIHKRLKLFIRVPNLFNSNQTWCWYYIIINLLAENVNLISILVITLTVIFLRTITNVRLAIVLSATIRLTNAWIISIWIIRICIIRIWATICLTSLRIAYVRILIIWPTTD